MGGAEGEVFLFGVLTVLGVVGILLRVFGSSGAEAEVLAMQWKPRPPEDEERPPESGVRRKAGVTDGRAASAGAARAGRRSQGISGAGSRR